VLVVIYCCPQFLVISRKNSDIALPPLFKHAGLGGLSADRLFT
jgi:hypothetical protein